MWASALRLIFALPLHTFQVNALSPSYAWVVVTTDCGNTCKGSATAAATPYVTVAPGAEGYAACSGSHVQPGVNCGFYRQEACESFSRTLPPVMVTLNATSPLGVYLKDDAYSDNVAGSPNPGWCARVNLSGLSLCRPARALLRALGANPALTWPLSYTQDGRAGLVLALAPPATPGPAAAQPPAAAAKPSSPQPSAAEPAAPPCPLPVVSGHLLCNEQQPGSVWFVRRVCEWDWRQRVPAGDLHPALPLGLHEVQLRPILPVDGGWSERCVRCVQGLSHVTHLCSPLPLCQVNALSPSLAWVVVTTDCGNTCKGSDTAAATPYVAVAPGANGYARCSGSRVPGVDCGFPDQASCEAFSRTWPPAMVTLNATSPLGMYLKDDTYTDNVAGSPNPGWCASPGTPLWREPVPARAPLRVIGADPAHAWPL